MRLFGGKCLQTCRITCISIHLTFFVIFSHSVLRIESRMSKEEKIRILQQGVGNKNEKLAARAEVNAPRKKLPSDWDSSRFSNLPLQCGESYSVAREFIRFSLKSEDTVCSYGFLGSKVESCTASILCEGIIKIGPKTPAGCEKEFFAITDGTTGLVSGCDYIDFDHTPRKSRNAGTDLQLSYRGESSAICVAFCMEDLRPDLHPKIKTQCGRGRREAGRIVGGENAFKFEFPWLGFVAFEELERQVVCGAALITDYHVISAAHCFITDSQFHPFMDPLDIDLVFHAHVVDKMVGYENETDEYYTSIPGWDLPRETDESENSVRVSVDQIIVHPLFNRETYDYDIAILKLAKRINLDDGRVSTICLPKLNETLDLKSSKMIVSGWGRHKEKAPMGSRILQKLEVPFIDWDICKRNSLPTRRHICAGYGEGGKDSCRGDSGGPLIYKFGSNQFLLSGIVSAGVGCARAERYGTYTNVQAPFLDLLPNFESTTTMVPQKMNSVFSKVKFYRVGIS